MRSIEYVKTTSWAEASTALAADSMAKAIAGGSDLLGWIKEEVVGPAVPAWTLLVDLRSIEGSDAVVFDERNGLRIGALATLSTIEAHPDVQRRFPALAKAAGAVASPNIRNAGTIGGNLQQRPRCWYFRNTEFTQCYKKGGDFCYAVTGRNAYNAILEGELCYIVHPSDTAPALMALGAKAVVVTPKGEKTVSFDDYFTGPRVDVLRENILLRGDLLREIRIPTPKAGTGMSFIKAQRRGETYDFALVNIATVLAMKDGKVDGASIVLSGVAPTPYRATAAEEAIKGKTVDTAIARNAAEQTLLKARPMTENAYKVDLAKNLIVRSIAEAAANAGKA